MSDRIFAPFTERQVAALNACQRSGVMHPFTCAGEHELHQTLVAEPDGWHCPDEACDYRQTWAHAFMAQPTAVTPPPWPQPPDSPMAAELKRTRQQLRETETQLGEERGRAASLTQQLTTALLRIQALQVHEAICRVQAAIPAPAGPACGEIILGGKPIDAAGSIDTYEEAGA